jgi:hypothetical protein
MDSPRRIVMKLSGKCKVVAKQRNAANTPPPAGDNQVV